MKLFRSATLKLTLWYLGILMTVSIAFSVVIFNISSQELERPLPPGARARLYQEDATFEAARQQRAEEGRQHLMVNLVILNFSTLALGAGASYFFARRTLQPIEEAMEGQIRFVSDASHEFRTPLAVMRTENEVALRDKKPSAAYLRETLESNLDEITRLQLLTDRLLALTTETTLPLADFIVDDAVHNAIKRHATLAKAAHMSVQYTSNAIMGHAHQESVEDILSILIENAIKYSPDKSRIIMTAELQAKQVLITVCDEGPGISETDLPHIFERFYRSDLSRSKKNTEGYGLGLALAKRLAQSNGAELSVRNNPKKGASFTLTINKSSAK